MNPWPPLRHRSHIVKNRFPGVRLDIRAVVFIETFARPTVQAANPKCLFDAEMVFELSRVFYVDFAEDFGFPFNRFLAKLTMLGKP